MNPFWWVNEMRCFSPLSDWKHLMRFLSWHWLPPLSPWLLLRSFLLDITMQEKDFGWRPWFLPLLSGISETREWCICLQTVRIWMPYPNISECTYYFRRLRYMPVTKRNVLWLDDSWRFREESSFLSLYWRYFSISCLQAIPMFGIYG